VWRTSGDGHDDDAIFSRPAEEVHMGTAPRRSRFMAAATAIALAGGVGLGVAMAVPGSGEDLRPWTTTHGSAVMADGGGAGKVDVAPIVIPRKTDKPSPVLF
jgi:hypothetical protein